MDKNFTTPKLFGKLSLVNSPVVSQFTYLFISPHSPSQSFLKTFEQKIICFLWSQKPERIKRSVVYNNNYEIGGLKLLNLKVLCLILKVAFVQKLYLH